MRALFLLACCLLMGAAALAQAMSDRAVSRELRELVTRAADLSGACVTEIEETGAQGDACADFRAFLTRTADKRRRYRRRVDRAARRITRDFTEQTLGFTTLESAEQAILDNRAAAQAARQRLRTNRRRIDKLAGD